ncbi:hypothetical protein [Paenibacillus sp. L3-i20]|uniref:hypothetical protein n=1 Tax=Paenibacillus sp. L3-i20 TaxID=2905833 RepID=UPI001EDC935C|nr:hypothetical protein [Paenibacillus sp. L3-i20]GKU76496.1 hypothetical protein L3i20_v208930 [Paenibacillus sp. L3-i20]
MNSFKIYSLMWFVFIVLFSTAVIGLEIVEGDKITTTEYYGLNNLGVSFVFFVVIFSAAAYFFTLLPLSIFIRTFLKATLERMISYTVLFSLSGIVVFHVLFDDYFIESYGLNGGIAVLLFGIIGFSYAVVEITLDSFDKKRTVI